MLDPGIMALSEGSVGDFAFWEFTINQGKHSKQVIRRLLNVISRGKWTIIGTYENMIYLEQEGITS